jgi:ribonuclease J
VNPQLKIIPLGGFGNVNTNMFVYELDNDILLVDCGLGFPSEDMLGVDVLIPDISYLKDKLAKIRGLVITHGHDDHIGGLPYILPKLPGVPVYAPNLPAKLILDKLNEYPNIPKNVNVLTPRQPLQLGQFLVESIHVTHSIPESTQLLITTPAGTVYHGSDFKFDFTPVYKDFTDLQGIAQAGNKGIDLLLSDCLGSERKGYTPSETTLDDTFDRELRDCPGKFIVTSIGSNISRWYQASKAAVRHGRKIVIAGRSIDRNLSVAMKLGYFDIPRNAFADLRYAKRLPPNKICILAAGSQGQTGSALERIAFGEHKDITIAPFDKVVFSSDYIPGTEASVASVINELSRKQVTVIYTAITDNLHVSGHGSQQDLLLLLSLTRPKYILPFGGNYNHMVQYSRLAQTMGYTQDKIFIPQANQTILVSPDHVSLGPPIPLRNVMVDGLGIGDVGQIVLRDRQQLAEEGIVIAVVEVEQSNLGNVVNFELINRGFVFEKYSSDLLNQAVQKAKNAIQAKNGQIESDRHLKQIVIDALGRFLFDQTHRRPMILPVVVEV